MIKDIHVFRGFKTQLCFGMAMSMENIVWNFETKNKADSGSLQHDGQRGVHDDVIKWNFFLRCWPFVRGIHRSPVNSPHKGQWLGALTFSLICAWINGWVNNHEAGDLRRHRAHYDVVVRYHLQARAVAYVYYHTRFIVQGFFIYTTLYHFRRQSKYQEELPLNWLSQMFTHTFFI